MDKFDQVISTTMVNLESFFSKSLNDPFTVYIILACLLMIIVSIIIAILRLFIKENKHKDVVLKPIVVEVTKDPVVKPIEASTTTQLPEAVEDTIDLSKVLAQMEQDLKEDNTAIDTFEQMQEEKSIISFQELLASVEPSTVVPLPDTNDEIIIEQPKRFKNSEFISPVYGKFDSDYKPTTINSEAKNKNEEFLNVLKDFRKSLD